MEATMEVIKQVTDETYDKGLFPRSDEGRPELPKSDEENESPREKLLRQFQNMKWESDMVPSGNKEVALAMQTASSEETQSVVDLLRTVEPQQVQVYESGQWVIDINQSMKENHTYDDGKAWSIYRAPERLRQVQQSAFAPKLVSIGPFHRKDRHLQAGNEHKMRFLVRLLGGKFKVVDTDDEDDSCNNHQVLIVLENLERTMKLQEIQARACYSEAFNDMTSDEFVQMMVLDGCFIIEVLRLYYEFENSPKHRDNVNDPIFHSHWMIQTLQSDFLMYENQLPFYLLKQLFSLTSIIGCVKLETLCRFFFNSLMYPNKRDPICATPEENLMSRYPYYHHLLHLFHDGFTSKLQGEKNAVEESRSGLKEYRKLSYHARELQEAGVGIINRNDDEKGLLGIDIIGGTQLRMNPLYLDDTGAVMLLNFLAFEQCCQLIDPYFTNYIVFLDCLIDNEFDVEVLHKAGVLNHAFGNNNDVANLINKVGREIVCDPSYNYLHRDMEELNIFCKSYYASRVRTWWRNLIRNYFSTPWTVISLAAAVLLLILTLVQTFYSTYAYYQPPN